MLPTGLGDALVKIRVAIASDALLELFFEFVMPKVKERFGDKAVGQGSAENGDNV
ncbi:hypothetical protein [Arsenicitalea aurantiaca]|uniref:hypothetical protein n=1 Tax=Arsenicitalea aurantiaca TaxID=1783274 RepID=UPI00131521A0|nr:hypothetical protein [Arsenicitalea aurantiaca]